MNRGGGLSARRIFFLRAVGRMDVGLLLLAPRLAVVAQRPLSRLRRRSFLVRRVFRCFADGWVFLAHAGMRLHAFEKFHYFRQAYGRVTVCIDADIVAQDAALPVALVVVGPF